MAVPAAAQAPAWSDVLAKARGQTVHWNAWAGDEKTNAFVAWVGDEAEKRYGVKVVHVKLKDTAEAVQRVVAEKAAGRDAGGSVDLIWINGPNFLAMKEQKLLYGPYAERLPNWRYVDTVRKRSNLIDFTIPKDGYESPWRMAQIVFVYDGKRVRPTPPDRSRSSGSGRRRTPGASRIRACATSWARPSSSRRSTSSPRIRRCCSARDRRELRGDRRRRCGRGTTR